MRHILLPSSAALAACTPSPEDTAMRTLPATADAAQPAGPSESRQAPVAPVPQQPEAVARAQAALGPSPAPVSAAENPLPTREPGPAARATFTGDTSATALGRRTLSTAFVRIGPDGHLTVELRDGRVLVLGDVVMRAADYCGTQVTGDRSGKRFCGNYADVAAARPGGGPATVTPVPADGVAVDGQR